jgi:hypothetical protein
MAVRSGMVVRVSHLPDQNLGIQRLYQTIWLSSILTNWESNCPSVEAVFEVIRSNPGRLPLRFIRTRITSGAKA